MTREEAIEIYKGQFNRFDGTRKAQWQFNIAAWTLIVLGTYASDKIKASSVSNSQIAILAFVFFLAHVIYVWRIQRVFEATKIISTHIVTELNKDTDPKRNIIIDIDALTKCVPIKSTGLWWILFQLLATSVLNVFLSFGEKIAQPPNIFSISSIDQ